MGNIIKYCLFVLSSLLLCCVFSIASAVSIKKIVVEGLERLPRETVASYLELSVPGDYDQEHLDSGVRKLFATGLFADVKIASKNEVLNVYVVENPLVYRVAFEGNKRVTDKDLQNALELKPQSVYSAQKLYSDVKRIVHAYHVRGLYAVQVEPKMVKLSQNRIDLVYDIKEGSKAKIQQINFIGNKQITDHELSSVILSQEYVWYRIFGAFENYDPDRLVQDQELLRMYYMSLGFADFQVLSVSTELSHRKNSFIITFVLNEGEAYKVNDIQIKSNIPSVDHSKLKDFVLIQRGERFNLSKIEASVDLLNRHLNDSGYAFSEVDYQIEKNNINGKEYLVDVKFIINEGSRVYINKINIRDNVLTRDSVIRRRFRLNEGDPYNDSKLLRSKQRISNLGYFSLVEFAKSKTEHPDRIDIDVRVKEIPTGSVRFSVGYNSQNGPLGTVSLQENNFLGKGQVVEMELTRGQRNSDIVFSFTEPYFLEKDLAAGFSIFSNIIDKTENSAYEEKRYGGRVHIGYDLGEYLSHAVSYGLFRQEVAIPKKDNVSLLIKEMSGQFNKSLVSHALTYNKLDSDISPTNGYFSKFTQELAGIGGDSKYFKNELYTSVFLPLYKRSIVLNIFGRAGYVSGIGDNGVKLVDNFFLGESYVRGFENSGIGPRDVKRNDNGDMLVDENKKPVFTDALGSKYFYAATAEITFPIGLPEEFGVKGAVFVDAGSAWGLDTSCKKDADFNKCQSQYDQVRSLTNKNSLRVSGGLGVVWDSPLGKIRVDYGVPIASEVFDKKNRLRIMLGYNIVG